MKRTFCLRLCCLLTASVLMLPGHTVFAAEDQAIGQNAVWDIQDGVLTISGTGNTYSFDLFEGELREDCPWFDRRDEITSVVVEEGITVLGKYLLAQLPNLKTVWLADSVSSIWQYCFCDCPSLTEIRIPKDTVLGLNLFDGDTALFPDTDFQIINEEYLYAYVGDAPGTVTVPESIRTIGSSCFQNHTEITEIVLPKKLENLGGGALQGCTALTSVSLPDTLREIGAVAFSGCTGLKSVVIPQTVKSIGDGAFALCTSLQSIRLPASLTELSMITFVNCTALTDVTFAGEQLEKVQYLCFQGCTALTSLELPASVQHIGDGAFRGCKKLEEVTVPETIQYIAADAFDGCDLLKELHTADGMFVLGTVLIRAEPKFCVLRIPEGITTAASYSVSKTRAVAVECPDSLRYICREAFPSNSDLCDIVLNDGCLTVGENAFSGCTGLKSLEIPASVTEIGVQENCGLTDIYGTAGTAAEQFAERSGIPFHAGTKLPQDGPDMTFDFSKDIWSFGNSRTVFGSGDYFLTDADRQYLESLGIDPANAGHTWSGSCVGLAVTAILAKNGVFSPSQLQAGAGTLSEAEPTDAVRSFINYYHCIQAEYDFASGYEPDSVQFYRMLKIAGNVPNGTSPFLLTFATKTGSHGVAGYGLEKGEWEFDGKTYDGRVLVWDSNFPKALHDESCLYYDSETFDYCIPYYGVHVADGADDNTAGIITVCSDLAVLNAYPYPFAVKDKKGDIDCSGAVQIADAVLLARYLAEDAVTVTAQGLVNAELDGDTGLTAGDLSVLLQYLAGTVPAL